MLSEGDAEMTNAEFKNKFEKMVKEIFPYKKFSLSELNKLTVNELIFVLRHDNEVSDYCLNINSESLGFSFGLLKESYFPTRELVLKIKSLEYEYPDDSEVPTLLVKTN